MTAPTRFPSSYPRIVGPALAAVAALGLAACATSKVDAEWTDPSIRGQATSLRGSSVLVACEAPDVAIRNICQDQLAAEVTARGAKPLLVPPETALTRDRSLDQQLLPTARTSGATAVLVVTLTPVATENDRPSLSFGLGGLGFGGGSAVGGGVGVSTPVGAGRVSTGYSANGRISDVASGRLLWSATAVEPPSKDLGSQFGALSVHVLDSASRAGLF